MRAVQLTEFGGPEVLKLVELDVPEPAEGEVLIRVSRAGINFADTHQRENAYIARRELPFVPGGRRGGEHRGPAREAVRRREDDRHGRLGGEAGARARARRRRGRRLRRGGPHRRSY